LDQLALRHIWDHRQFTSDEDLLKRAGLIDDIVMPLSERMMLVEEAAQKKLNRVPAVTPPPELSVRAPWRSKPVVSPAASRKPPHEFHVTPSSSGLSLMAKKK
jgi:hypothetical protein